MTDAHLHLHFESLRSHLAEIFEVYRELGVKRVVVNGTGPDDWASVAALAEDYEIVIPSYGLHPWKVNDQFEEMETWANGLHGFVLGNARAGVGECGLDKWIKGHDLENQEEAFRPQVALAAEEDRPLSIHCLQCWGRMLDVLREVGLPERGFLLHAYGGPRELVGAFAELGAFFSFNGYFLHERKAAQVEAFREVPRGRFLVESDSPDMLLPDGRLRFKLPPDREGKVPNHPGNIAATFEAVEELFGHSAEVIDGNFTRFFGDE